MYKPSSDLLSKGITNIVPIQLYGLNDIQKKRKKLPEKSV